MSGRWQGSNRHSRLPNNWQQLRANILQRDGHRCTVFVTATERCTRTATQVDHIRAGDDHTPTNLAAICEPHHAAKSSREGSAARWRLVVTRPAEPHPGLIRR